MDNVEFLREWEKLNRDAAAEYPVTAPRGIKYLERAEAFKRVADELEALRSPLDVCQCGESRDQHPHGGPSRLNGLAGPERDCQGFRFSSRFTSTPTV